MNRDDLEPKILKCVTRIEQAVETMYLEWYFYPKQESKKFEFSYRIEIDNHSKNKQGRIRLRSGSETNRKTFFIGRADLALKGLIFLQETLCDRATIDLQRILSSGKFPFWFSKEIINGVTPESIIKLIASLSNKIRPGSVPIMFDLENFSGFFIEDSYKGISCQILEKSVNVLDAPNLESSLALAITKILPRNSISSFNITRHLGNFWMGIFSNEPYYFYVDIGWSEGKYQVKLLNIAGFVQKNFEKKSLLIGVPNVRLSKNLD
jgi:hypothetical protein